MPYLAVLLALWSILNWFEYDILLFWQLSVLSREFGHWLFLIAILVAILIWRRRFLYPKKQRSIAVLSALLAAVGFARPVALALRDRESYRQELVAFQQKRSDPTNVPVLFTVQGLFDFGAFKDEAYRRIEYPGPGGGRLHADFYSAQNVVEGTKPPLVIVVHGGSWEGGTTQQLPALNSDLARAGYGVASLSYRFSPTTPWPGQLEDVVAGIKALREQALALNFDPDRMVILGRSAGGQVAGVVAYSQNELPIKGYINFYGPTDLDFGFEITIDGDIIDSRNILRRFLKGDPVSAVEEYRSSSVIESAKIRPVPTLLLYGEEDRLVWHKHGERLRRRLIQSGTPVALIDMKWGVHGFDFNPRGPGGLISRNAVHTFLESVLK